MTRYTVSPPMQKPFPPSGKIKVTPEESVIVQEALFSKGFCWVGSTTILERFNSLHFLFWNHGEISFCYTGGVFDDSSNPEYTMSLFAPVEVVDEEIFTNDFLAEIGFKRVPTSGEPQYGKAIDIRTNGMTTLQWNTEGHSCTYFGDKLESNVGFAIRKDADTRYAFNGYVFNREQVKLLLSLTL